jgi:hypothetical protein
MHSSISRPPFITRAFPRYTLQVTDVRAEAKKILAKQSDLDESERQYLLEYYSLVRENKTNYVATLAFQQVCGTILQEATEFFKVYSASFDPKELKSPKSPASPNKRYFYMGRKC